MVVGDLLSQFGLFGLLVGLVAHIAYNVYENRFGAVKDVSDQVDDAHQRLDGVGVILYRKAKDDWEGIDEDELRDMLFNGHEVTFPSDFEDDGYYPEAGGDMTRRPEGSDEAKRRRQ